MVAWDIGGVAADDAPALPAWDIGDIQADGTLPVGSAVWDIGGTTADGTLAPSLMPLSNIVSRPGVIFALTAVSAPGAPTPTHYEWFQEPGLNLSLSTDGSATATIVVPSVHPSETEFTNTVTVIASIGGTASYPQSMTVTALPETRFKRTDGVWSGASQPPPA